MCAAWKLFSRSPLSQLVKYRDMPSWKKVARSKQVERTTRLHQDLTPDEKSDYGTTHSADLEYLQTNGERHSHY